MEGEMAVRVTGSRRAVDVVEASLTLVVRVRAGPLTLPDCTSSGGRSRSDRVGGRRRDDGGRDDGDSRGGRDRRRPSRSEGWDRDGGRRGRVDNSRNAGEFGRRHGDGGGRRSLAVRKVKAWQQRRQQAG